MSFFKKYLSPDMVFAKMSNIPFSDLYEKGYRFALLDLDNTLAEDHVHEPSDYTRHIITGLKDAGFTCCIVSNAKSTRSADFAAMIPIDCISFAGKPSASGIFRAMDLLLAKKEECVLFGDQIFTDILAARRAGIFAVLVEPYDRHEVFYVRIKRPFERIVRFMNHF